MNAELAKIGPATHPLCGTPAQNSLPWYCIKTEPNRESRALRSLELLNIETFLPEFTRRNISRPLFPSYLFARLNLQRHSHSIKTSPGVSYILSFGPEPMPVEESIIQAIRNGLCYPPAEFQPGQSVRITSGAFEGIEGVFRSELSGTERVIILLNSLRFHGKIELYRDEIEPLTSVRYEPSHT